MKVIGWTNWYDPRYPDDFSNDPLLEERKQAVAEELRKHNYHINGFYHQSGERGVPVFDDGNWLRVTFRTWGQIMADAFPEETGVGQRAYVQWAWAPPGGPDNMILPKQEDYPDFDYREWRITEEQFRRDYL